MSIGAKLSNKLVFVSATDTDVGKTYCSRLLVEHFQKQNKKVAYYKPIESGYIKGKSDVDYIAEVCNDVFYDFRLTLPISPHLAAREDKVEIDIDLIKERVSWLKENYDVVIIEGAGGLLVPIKTDYDFSNLLIDLNAKLLLVVGSKLGAINQSKLNFEYISSRNINCLGYIYNEFLESDEAIDRNQEAIKEEAKKYKLAEVLMVNYRDDKLTVNKEWV